MSSTLAGSASAMLSVTLGPPARPQLMAGWVWQIVDELVKERETRGAFDPGQLHLARHAGFGRGGHIRVGQFLARLLLEEPPHRVSRRLRHPRLTGALEWRTFLGAMD